MSARTDNQARARAMAVAKLAKQGNTNREIALLMSIEVQRIPALRKLGETLLALRPQSDNQEDET